MEPRPFLLLFLAFPIARGEHQFLIMREKDAFHESRAVFNDTGEVCKVPTLPIKAVQKTSFNHFKGASIGGSVIACELLTPNLNSPLQCFRYGNNTNEWIDFYNFGNRSSSMKSVFVRVNATTFFALSERIHSYTIFVHSDGSATPAREYSKESEEIDLYTAHMLNDTHLMLIGTAKTSQNPITLFFNVNNKEDPTRVEGTEALDIDAKEPRVCVRCMDETTKAVRNVICVGREKAALDSWWNFDVGNWKWNHKEEVLIERGADARTFSDLDEHLIVAEVNGSKSVITFFNVCKKNVTKVLEYNDNETNPVFNVLSLDRDDVFTCGRTTSTTTTTTKTTITPGTGGSDISGKPGFKRERLVPEFCYCEPTGKNKDKLKKIKKKRP